MTKKSEARLARDEADKTPLRTMEEIDKDYNHTCGLAGQTQYRLKVLEQELNALNSKLWNLNQEAARVREAAAKETATEAAAPEAAAPSLAAVEPAALES